MKIKIHYISHGPFKSGGYRHEIQLFEGLVTYYRKICETKSQIHRAERYFQTLGSHMYLIIWSFFKASADINIVVRRCALSAIIRHYFTQKQVWIVLHNDDVLDGRSEFFKRYQRILFGLIRRKHSNRFKIITVSPYWETYFSEELQLPHVYVFPNLFDTELYAGFRKEEKNAWIHLGQYSSKNDPEIESLAARLTRDGYYCFFSTPDTALAAPSNGKYEVICFHDFKDYLEQISMCCCTLALSKIAEGWNRTAHESILLGTPVIGYKRAGLGDLLHISSSVVVKNPDEAYDCIKQSIFVLPDSGFYRRFDMKEAEDYIVEICKH